MSQQSRKLDLAFIGLAGVGILIVLFLMLSLAACQANGDKPPKEFHDKSGRHSGHVGFNPNCTFDKWVKHKC